MPRALIAIIVAMAVPATASAKEFCVKNVLCTAAGGTPVAGVQEAFDAAVANPGRDDIAIGAGNFSGNFTSDDPDGVTVSGMGVGQTTIFPAASGQPNYPFALSMKGISYLSDLRIGLSQVFGAKGLSLSAGASAKGIQIDGGGPAAVGAELDNAALWDSKIDLYDNVGATAAQVQGAGARLEGDVLAAREALSVSLADGARTRVHATTLEAKGTDGIAAMVSGGKLWLADSLVDVRLAQQGHGVWVSQYASAPAAADLRNTTLVASGYAGQVGVTTDTMDYDVSSTATLTDSVLYGFGIPFRRQGGGDDSTFASISANGVDRWPDHPSTSTGAGTLSDTRALAVDPRFTNAAGGDFTLDASSPLIDAGLPGALGDDDPDTDMLGKPRLTDGNADCTAQRDIGAYERAATTCQPPAPGVTPDPGSQPGPPAAGDTTAPVLTHVKLRRRHRGLVVRFSLSEAATVKVLVGHRAVNRTLQAGARTVRLAKVSHRRIRIRLVATDQAGNHSSIARRLR